MMSISEYKKLLAFSCDIQWNIAFLIFKTFIIVIIIMPRANYHEFVNTIAFFWSSILVESKLQRDKNMCIYNSKLIEERKVLRRKKKENEFSVRHAIMIFFILFIYLKKKIYFFNIGNKETLNCGEGFSDYLMLNFWEIFLK